MLQKEIEYKRFVLQFSNLLKNNSNNNSNNNEIVFLCIGTNRVIGDSIGPIVGTNLKKKIDNNRNIKVFGDLENNICYENIKEYITKLSTCKSLIVVIDSALSNQENIGKVFVQNKGLKYGESLYKNNSIIGNISIKAVVGKNAYNKFKNFKVLKNTSINRVIYLSNIVSNGIAQVINSY